MSEQKQTVTVDANALREVLVALNGPGHYIRELKVTRGALFDNPIDKLIAEFNAQASGGDDADQG
jgi:hypothetical protein